MGPVVLIDTPGIDDEGELGELRVARSYQMLNKSDVALLVLGARDGMTKEDEKLLLKIWEKKIPVLVALNQCDLLEKEEIDDRIDKTRDRIKGMEGESVRATEVLEVSAVTGYHIFELKEKLAHLVPEENDGSRIVADLLDVEKIAVLVVPIDKAAPKGRLILPQQQTIRDILEAGAACVVVRDTELETTLRKLQGQVGIVITDSQAFAKVSKIVPPEIPLTSFSILFARYKGELEPFLQGVDALGKLEDGDKVLISEGCTHHRQCDDIGTVKIPRWITEYTGKKLEFSFSIGGGFPDDLTLYRMIVHCGACMLNAREMHYRIACAQDVGVPITNYGMLIAKITGILERSLEPVK